MDNGINTDKIRPFLALTLKNQSRNECIECDVGSGCSLCTGNNYDLAESDTIYQRATYICKIQKANVRANNYFWDKFKKVTGLESPREAHAQQKLRRAENETVKYMQFITSDEITPHCSYRNYRKSQNVMSRDIFDKGLKFARDNDYFPVFLGSAELDIENSLNFINSKSDIVRSNSFIVCDNNSDVPKEYNGNLILLISRNNIKNLYAFIKNLYQTAARVNVILEDIENWNTDDFAGYDSVLNDLVEFIADTYTKGKSFEVNVLTDLLDQKSMCNCDAGENTYALAPNGRIYICPAFYFDNEDSHIGDLDHGINIKNSQLLELENAPICSLCDSYQCLRCKYLNKKLTNEISIPSKIQCRISHLERSKSISLQKLLIKNNLIPNDNIIKEISYTDPLEKILCKQGVK